MLSLIQGTFAKGVVSFHMKFFVPVDDHCTKQSIYCFLEALQVFGGFFIFLGLHHMLISVGVLMQSSYVFLIFFIFHLFDMINQTDLLEDVVDLL